MTTATRRPQTSARRPAPAPVSPLLGTRPATPAATAAEPFAYGDIALLPSERRLIVHQSVNGDTRLLSSPIPDYTPPTVDEAEKYVAARRFTAAHADEVQAYWTDRRAIEEDLRVTREAQRDRFATYRDLRIQRYNVQLDELDARIGATASEYDRCCRVIQDFRHRYYGCWYTDSEKPGLFSSRLFKDGWARSYGTLVRHEPPVDPARPDRPLIVEVRCTRNHCWKLLTMAGTVPQSDRAAMLGLEMDALRLVLAHERETGHQHRMVLWYEDKRTGL